ncbi:MAG: DMT family transporter [Proteobacteria bacterium]|nr:DMT family transporter [Pseudomonadota bacterium]
MGELAALAAAACWAFASVLWARLGQTWDVFALNFLKCGFAAAALAATLWFLDGTAWPMGLSSRDLFWLGFSGIAGLTIGDSAYFGALTRIGPRRSLLIWAMSPGLSALLAWPVLGEPIDGRMLVGMTVTLAGVLWVLNERTPEDDDGAPTIDRRTFAIGVGLATIALLGQSSSNVLQKYAGIEAGALGLSVIRLSVATLGLGVWLGATVRVAAAIAPMREVRSRNLLLLATLVGTYTGIWLSAYGLLNADVGVASTLNATSPIFVLPFAAAFGGERVSGRAIAGAFVAVAGVAVFFLT